MMKNQHKETPSTIEQLAAAMTALGMYHGENSDAEHQAEAKRLGSEPFYRVLLANALLGAVEAEAMLADSEGLSHDQMGSAHRQVRITAGVEDNPGKLLSFLRWQVLRVEGPLREFAQDQTTGPIVLAAAHAAEGLQLLLGICAEGQNLEQASPDALTKDLKAARESLINARDNVDIMLKLIARAEDLYR